ncbi:MAG: MerR family transcriptional regulator [Burkholderiaceae bacterium]
MNTSSLQTQITIYAPKQAILQLKDDSLERRMDSTEAAAKPLRAAPQPTFRSGAVARMAHMPVSTLRIWEQRYRAVGPATTPSGHRLYSAADVQRVLLLRQLAGEGHAIGAIAALDVAQLQQLTGTPAAHAAGERIQSARRTAVLRVTVVGRALALRLQRPVVVGRLAHRWQVAAVFESLTDASHAATGAEADLLLWQAPGLQVSALPELKAAREAWRARHVAVAYRFAGAGTSDAFAGTGATVVSEPADDGALGAWLASLESASMVSGDVRGDRSAPHDTPDPAPADVAPRRFDDAALTAFAGLSTTIACECPRHVAELLMQLSNFETYSADCANRSPVDAALHAYLKRVAGVSRALFETALERVARHEGLRLP